MVVVVGTLMGIRRFKQRKEPVPVEKREVGIRISRGMPAQQMIVMFTHLANPVVMANVVIIGLRQGHVDDAQNHDPDSQDSQPRPVIVAPRRHVETRFLD